MLKQHNLKTQDDNQKWQLLMQMCRQILNSVNRSEQFAQQLHQDYFAHKNEQMITDCANWTPHLYTAIDKKTQLAHQIAMCLYPNEGEENMGSSLVIESVVIITYDSSLI